MEFDYKNILIMGYGRSGQAVENIIKKLKNVNYKIYDKSKRITGAQYYARLNKKIIRSFDLIVISPGVSIYNKYLVYAEKIGIKVIGELEFGYWFTDSPVIAITGTNGKTTTTKLTTEIIENKYKTGAFGNIGLPLSEAYNDEKEYYVCEVSSFQLESTCMFKPYISVILNIAEDHLDRHKTFENYINCKLGLLKNCTEKSLVVLNADDKVIMDRTQNIKARKYYISQYEKVKGVYISNNKIYSNLNKVQEIMELQEVEHLFGVIEDVLASILISLLMKVEKDDIVKTIKTFKVFDHRLEVVANKNNIKYINDSKSTNVHSSMHALSCIDQKTILLLGGEDKSLNFYPLFEKYSTNIDMVVAFGSARKKIVKVARMFEGIEIKENKFFVDAVKIACEHAKENNVVLLSPACTSFDEFDSYVERGEAFKKIVKGYIDAKN